MQIVVNLPKQENNSYISKLYQYWYAVKNNKEIINVTGEHFQKFPSLQQLYELDQKGVLEMTDEFFKADVLDALNSSLGKTETFPGLYIQHLLGANINSMKEKYPINERIFDIMKLAHTNPIFINCIKESLNSFLNEGRQFHSFAGVSETFYKEVEVYYTLYFQT